MSKLTVAWDRAENAAYLPPSGVVYPPAKLTVAWRPIINSSVLDWDPADLLVTPGAGADAAPAPGAGAGAPGTPAPGTPAPGGASPGPTTPRPKCAPGAPDIRVGLRRTPSLFRKDGLSFEVIAPADANVRAALTAVTGNGTGRVVRPRARRKLTRTVTKTVRCGKRQRIRLPIALEGRRAIKEHARLQATLEIVMTYKGAKPVTVKRSVLLVESPKTKKKKTG